MTISKITNSNSQPRNTSEAYIVRAKHFNPVVDEVNTLSEGVDALGSELDLFEAAADTYGTLLYGVTSITAFAVGGTMSADYKTHTVTWATGLGYVKLPALADAEYGYEYHLLKTSVTGFYLGTQSPTIESINGATYGTNPLALVDDDALLVKIVKTGSRAWTASSISATGLHVNVNTSIV